MPLNAIGLRAIGFGLVLTTATKLRFGNLPIGPGEIIIAGLLCAGLASLAHNPLKSLTNMTPIAVRLMVFWCLFLASYGVGAWCGVSLGVFKPGPALHDTASLMFSAAFCTWAAMIHWDQARFEQVALTILTVLVAIELPLLIATYAARLSAAPLPTDYFQHHFLAGNKEFLGWSHNINQIVIPMICGLPLAWNRLGQVGLFNRKGAAWAVLLAGTYMLGIFSFSRTFLVAQAAYAFFAALLVLGRKRGLSPSWAFFWMMTAIACLYAGTMALYAMRDVMPQHASRFQLFCNGIEAIAASWGLGLGPGNFSGATAPFQGMEAHNLFLDVAMSGGVAALFLFLLLYRHCLLCVSRLQNTSYQAIHICLFIFLLFHFPMRHPLFWFYMIFPALIQSGAQLERE